MRIRLLAALFCGLASVSSIDVANANIAYVSKNAAVASSAGTTCTVTAPGGVAMTSGNVAVLVLLNLGVAAQTVSSIGDASWIPATGNATSVGAYVYTRVVPASDSTTWTWTFNASSQCAWALYQFSGVNATTPVDKSETGSVPGSTNTYAAAAQSQTNAGEMVVAITGSVDWGGRSSIASSPATPEAVMWQVNDSTVAVLSRGALSGEIFKDNGVQNAAGASISDQWTWGASGSHNAYYSQTLLIPAAFTPVQNPTNGRSNRLMMGCC